MPQQTNAELSQITEQVIDLITLPEIYLKISRLMDDSYSSIDDFAEVVRHDPSLSSTVLKVVNSAFYGFSGEVDSVDRAINLIGIGQLHIIALSASAISALDCLQYPKNMLSLKTFWRCSLFTGVLARQLALLLNQSNSERFFVSGLLHEIGYLALYTKRNEITFQVAQLKQQKGINQAQAEQQILGFHYGDVGAELMSKWNLPHFFQHITQHQPFPQNVNKDALSIALLHIAHGYAHHQFIDVENELDQLIHTSVWTTTKITPDQVNQTLESTRSISADLEKIILR